MGIIAKALRKSQTEAVRPSSEALQPITPEAAGRPALPVQLRKASIGPAKRPAPPAAEPATVRAEALGRGAEVSAPAAGPAPAAISPDAADLSPPPEPEAAPRQQPETRPAAGRIAPDLVSLVNPDGPEADLFRLLRTRILFPQAGKRPPRTILVTSALPEEGKSFVAANLAVNLARNVDEHVLLVDCDLRKPSVHARFGFNGVKGLSEYLSDGLELPPLLLKASVDKLTLLPSGAPPANPSELVSSARMAGLIEELKSRYDDRYIILDSPPPMMAPETSAIAKWADGILVVVKYGTSMDMVEELVDRLDREKIIGTVINKINEREFRRYAYKKYYAKSKYYSA